MSLALQLKDYRLTTAEILYRLPDHPEILQTYVWQDLDIAPVPRAAQVPRFLASRTGRQAAFGAGRLHGRDQACHLSLPGAYMTLH